jgi:hypothetical protein
MRYGPSALGRPETQATAEAIFHIRIGALVWLRDFYPLDSQMSGKKCAVSDPLALCFVPVITMPVAL